MIKIISEFESVDLAEFASKRLKSAVDSIRTVQVIDNRNLSPGPAPNLSIIPATYIDGSTSYFNAPGDFALNFQPTDSPWNARIGYFEPQQRGNTLIEVRVSDEEAKRAERVLRNMGGQRIHVISD